MKKEEYIKPDITVIEFPYECTILATSVSIESDVQGDYNEDFAKERRRTWGNLWQENERPTF